MKRIWPAAWGFLLLLFAARSARAAFVVVDVTYTHSAQTTTDSHYHVQPLPGTPANWKSPIDYASGQAYVRLEVKTKPTDTPTRFQICFELPMNYACTDQSPIYTKIGTYTWGTKFSAFYLGGAVDWSRGLRQTALILKDTNNVKPAPENVGAQVSALYMPSDVHVTVTLVPPGETYVPPAAMDAGTTDAMNESADAQHGATDDASNADSAPPPLDNPPGSDAPIGTPAIDSAAPLVANSAPDGAPDGSGAGRQPAGAMDAGCTCSQVRSRSYPGPLGWAIGFTLVAAMRRRRDPERS